MSERTERKAKLLRVQAVLRWAWDPIGLCEILPADEYDSYALPVLGMLERGVDGQEIANYLTSVERDRMGLQPAPKKNAHITALLRELHAIAP